MWRSKYLRRLIVFCLILVTLPVLSLGILSYGKARGIIEDKVVQGNMQVLLQTQLKAEQLLQTIDNSMIQFTNSSLVTQSIRTALTARDFQKINDLTEGLHKLQTYDVGIQNVRLTSLEGRWQLDNSAFSSVSDDDLKALTELSKSVEMSAWITDEQDRTVKLVKKLPLNTVNHPAGMLEVMLPHSRLQKLVPETTDESMTLIMDEDYRLLTDDPDLSPFPMNSLDQIVSKLKKSEEPEGYQTLQVDHRAIGISYRRSDYNGWIYMSLVSIGQITKDSRAIGFYTLWICSAVFLVLLAVSLFGSRRMYRPIRQVIEIGLGRPLEPEESFRDEDEFQVIGEHIRSLKYSQTKLLEQIQGQTRQLKEFFVRKLLLGELSGQEIREKAVQYHYGMESGRFCVLTAQIDSLEGTRFENSDRDLLMFAVNNIVSELLPAGDRLDPVVLGGNQVTLLRVAEGIDEAGKDTVYETAGKVQSTVRSLLELKISIGISAAYDGLASAAQAYRESLEALKYRIRFGEEAILHIEDVLPDRRVQAGFPEWIEKQMIDALMIPDLVKASELLGEFLNMATRENIHHQEYQMILFRLLSDLIREAQNIGEPLPLFSDGERAPFEEMIHLKTVAETEAWFMKKVMEPMVSLMSRKWEARNRNISDRMKEIIHNDFGTDLTLDVCAAKLNYHPNYLKTVFRKETGVNFSDYLSQVRLNQAKKWLLETDLKITVIAERLCYQNPQNFIRYFRKMEGMTPGDYRKKYQAV